tara:strand:+ start:431 stop:880 length:450 start_codon:yes stop_codon:yes gene_type:complete
MTLQERLLDDMKDAMRQRQPERLSVIRMIRAKIHNEEISKGSELDDETVTEVITRMAKQHRESIEQFRNGNRPDLVEKEETELATVMEYMPAQMSSEDISNLVAQVIKEVSATGPSDKGKVMGKLMPQVRGKADGNQVNTVVTTMLSAL